jgi:maleylacetate reductase
MEVDSPQSTVDSQNVDSQTVDRQTVDCRLSTVNCRLGFVYAQPSIRVIFGVGAIDRLREEVQRLGARRVFVLASPGQRPVAAAAARTLGAAAAGVFAEAARHVPIEVARAACETARRLGADCCVTIGGGSTIGLGKAIALERTLPVVAVPTTYSGSEMTPIHGVTEGGVKRTGRDRKVLPKVVLYDPALTVGLPRHISGPSGMNAIAHSVEALYASARSPDRCRSSSRNPRTSTRAQMRCTAHGSRERCSG